MKVNTCLEHSVVLHYCQLIYHFVPESLSYRKKITHSYWVYIHILCIISVWHTEKYFFKSMRFILTFIFGLFRGIYMVTLWLLLCFVKRFSKNLKQLFTVKLKMKEKYLPSEPFEHKVLTLMSQSLLNPLILCFLQICSCDHGTTTEIRKLTLIS